MKAGRIAGIVCVGVLVGVACLAADWAHWRGPTFNGVAESPTLVDAFAEGGPTKVWESEQLSTVGGIGYGSVSVVDGRAYTYIHTLYQQDIEERTVPRDGPARLGYVADMPKELLDVVEKARVSEARTALQGGRPINAWTDTWMKEHLKQEHRKYRRAVQARLRAGADAVPLETLAKLDGIKGKSFPSQAALDAWMNENNIDDNSRKQIARVVPTRKRASNDYACCLDATTGKTLWKVEIPTWLMWYAASCTPTVVDGRCYVLSSEAKVYCLDAKTGQKLWETESIGRRGNTHNRSSSVLIIDGVAVVQTAAQAAGFDIQTGKTLWKDRKIHSEYGSAVPHEIGGKKHAVIVGAGKVFCVEPKTGNIVWSVKGSDGPTPTIVGDRMAISCGKKGGLTFYKLTGAEPEVLWNVPFEDGFTSPVIHDGHVYAFGEAYTKRGKGRAVCVDAATGKVLWSEVLGPHQHSSPVVADGKLIAVGGGTLYLVKATPDKYTELGKVNAKLEKYASVSFADGKVFLRTGRTVVCYDLRK